MHEKTWLKLAKSMFWSAIVSAGDASSTERFPLPLVSASLLVARPTSAPLLSALCSSLVRHQPASSPHGDARWYINNIVDCIQLDDDYFYRVRWLTCSEAEDTWEKEEDLQGSAALRKWRYYQQIPTRLKRFWSTQNST
ncbi:hypothetical protein D9611_013716 [Ephemerocybe angulata]|uniref:Chromo domain-containing protein n=1 Tax=Ephemerocybe angulata TaxID=980116 RepID=A0A8H5BEC4_9AGAR|nr:hypothetical protein D9611_013716 [Tulosesus angulatus]